MRILRITRVLTFTREPVWSQNQKFFLPEKLKILRVFLPEDFLKKAKNPFTRQFIPLWFEHTIFV